MSCTLFHAYSHRITVKGTVNSLKCYKIQKTMPILSSHIHDKPWDNRRTQGTADMNTLLKS